MSIKTISALLLALTVSSSFACTLSQEQYTQKLENGKTARLTVKKGLLEADNGLRSSHFSYFGDNVSAMRRKNGSFIYASPLDPTPYIAATFKAAQKVSAKFDGSQKRQRQQLEFSVGAVECKNHKFYCDNGLETSEQTLALIDMSADDAACIQSKIDLLRSKF